MTCSAFFNQPQYGILKTIQPLLVDSYIFYTRSYHLGHHSATVFNTEDLSKLIENIIIDEVQCMVNETNDKYIVSLEPDTRLGDLLIGNKRFNNSVRWK